SRSHGWPRTSRSASSEGDARAGGSAGVGVVLLHDAERGGASGLVAVCRARSVPGRHAHEVARRSLRRCTSAGRPTRHEVPAGGSTHGLTVRGAGQVRIPRAGDYGAPRQPTTGTRTASAAAVVTYVRP